MWRLPTRFKPSACRLWRYTAFLLAAIALTLTACSLRDNPHYNPYAPTDRAPTLLQRTDQAAELPCEALDNLDRLIENVVY